MVGVTFEPIEEENVENEQIVFNADMDGQRIQCAITYQALRDYFEADYSDPLFAFMEARSKIENLANKIMSEGQILDNKLLITSQYIADNNS